MEILSLYSPNISVIKEKININQFLERYDTKQVLFIITPAVQKKISFSPKQGELVAGYSLSKEDLDRKIPELQHLLKILVIGASKVLDQAKYIASQLNIPLVVIPSIISTNAFSTGRSALKIDGKVFSIESKVPDEVYIIYSLLEMAPQKYNSFGLVDVLSIYTAIQDWNIAITDKKASLALEYYLAKGVLETFLSIKLGQDDYYNISKLILLSGLVVNMYGDGRPESGSEHIIAKAIESKIECFHAHSVSFGMLVIMKLQDSWNEDIVTIIRNITDWDSDYGKNILNQIEKNISSEDIKPRHGRYTVLDKVSGNKIENSIKEVINYLKT